MALVADMPQISAMFPIINFSFYVRTASILGLIIAAFTAWGFKRRFETSQKYLRADHVMAEAETKAKRREQNAIRIEEKLKADYERKNQALANQLAQLKAEHKDQLSKLKTQNIQLKEEISKLLRILKEKQADNSDKTKSESGQVSKGV